MRCTRKPASLFIVHVVCLFERFGRMGEAYASDASQDKVTNIASDISI